MEENKKISEAISEIKNADEETLRKVIEDWFESTRTDGLRVGAQLIATAIMSKIQKHLDKPGKASLRDYERCIADINKMLLVQLAEQNNSTENNISEENSDD